MIIQKLLELTENDGNELSIIPLNTETYIAVDCHIKVRSSRQEGTLIISFRDSYRFMSASLEKLAQNLESDDFKNLKCELSRFLEAKDQTMTPDDIANRVSYMTRKGVFPYDAVQSLADFAKPLPEKSEFSTILNNNEDITDEEYSFAQKVCMPLDLNRIQTN